MESQTIQIHGAENMEHFAGAAKLGEREKAAKSRNQNVLSEDGFLSLIIASIHC
jgi:hypothetical protein